ncbi:MAG: hypothetical protein ACI8PT_004008 [Gammaproteobacteria bacterium]|jgi:hypothetical protein
MNTTKRIFCYLLLAALCLLAAAYLAKGFHNLTVGDHVGDAVDLKLRWIEQRYFARGINPYDVWIANAGEKLDASVVDKWKTDRPSETVGDIGFQDPAHPPWSFVTSWVFFWPDWPAARFYYAGLCALAITFVAWWVYGVISPYGNFSAWLTMATVLAIGGGSLTLQVGQYGWLVLALLCAVLWLDGKGRAVQAGIALAFAVSKPTMGAPFLLSAFVMYRWATLMVGGSILLIASLLCWYWISTNPIDLLRQALVIGGVIGKDGSVGLTTLIIDLGVDQQYATLLGMATMLGVGIIGLFYSRRGSLLISFAIAGVIARTWTYHKSYDDLLIVFLLVATAKLAASTQSRLNWCVFSALALTLVLPSRFAAMVEVQVVQLTVWLAAAIFLIWASESVRCSSR